MGMPGYCKDCNQMYAPIDQQSCWACKGGDCNTSKSRQEQEQEPKRKLQLEDVTHEVIETLYADGKPVEWIKTIEPDVGKIEELLFKQLVTPNEIRELLGMDMIGKPIQTGGVDYARGWECPYCGSLNYEPRCTSCGAPRRV